MTCTKNPKSVLGMNINGDHDWHPSHIDKFMAANNVYRLTEYCSLCGLNRETLSYHYQLIKAGFTESEIAKAGFSNKVYHSQILIS